MRWEQTRRTTNLAMTLALVPLVVGTSAPTALLLQEPRSGAGSAASSRVDRDTAREGLLQQLDAMPAAGEGGGGSQVVGSPKGMRVWTPSEMGADSVPSAAMRAYRGAAAATGRTDPACRLSWTLLAAIGRVESDHGRYDGAVLGRDGVSRPRIIGVALDGVGPVAEIRDTDGGRLDGDQVWDRAVGPMQFIPSTWRTAARDGDGDGARSPHDLDDAALAAAGYLCAGGRSLADDAGRRTAVFGYNHDDYYVALVLAFERGYREGVWVMPPPPSADPDQTERRPRRAARRAEENAPSTVTGKARPRKTGTSTSGSQRADRGGSTKPSGATKPPGPQPKPSTSPEPTPKPTPAPPAPVTVTGTFQECDGGYCLGTLLLDLGQVADFGATAAGDFDGDGATETNGDEVAGMLGAKATMVVVKNPTGGAGIHSINGIPLA